MKVISQINAEIIARFENVDAIDGIAKQVVIGQDGFKLAIYAKDSEPYVFTPDDNYDIQVAHWLKSGKKDNNSQFNSVINEVEMVIISKYVKFYHIMDILDKLRLTFVSYDLNTRAILRNDLNFTEDYPEIEAYKIRYNFTSTVEDLISFEKLMC